MKILLILEYIHKKFIKTEAFLSNSSKLTIAGPKFNEFEDLIFFLFKISLQIIKLFANWE